MPLILAVEPDHRQASRIAAVLRTRPRTELVIEASAESALGRLADRVPDVLLTSPLLSPQDEAVIAGWLRDLGSAAANVQALTIPILSTPSEPPTPRRGILSVLRRRAARAPVSDGCEPAVFADQIGLYAERASAERKTPYEAEPSYVVSGFSRTSSAPLESTGPAKAGHYEDLGSDVAPLIAPSHVGPSNVAPSYVVSGFSRTSSAPLESAGPAKAGHYEDLGSDVAPLIAPSHVAPSHVAPFSALVVAPRRSRWLEADPILVTVPSVGRLPHVLAESRRRWIPGVPMRALPLPASGASARMVVRQPAGLAARLAFLEQTTLPPHALRPPMLLTSWRTDELHDVLAEWRRHWMAEKDLQVIPEVEPLVAAEAEAVPAPESPDQPLPFEPYEIAVADEDVWVLMPIPDMKAMFAEMAPASVREAMALAPVLEDVMPSRPSVDKPKSSSVPTLRKKPRRQKSTPVQDEWGFFDPDQCGFATLLSKLDAITAQEVEASERQSLGQRLGEARGATLLETAIVLPLLLLLTFSIVDFASVFYVYLALENGVSQATRYAITGNQMEDPDNPGEDLSREESIKVAMRGATPTLTIADEDFTFSHLPEGGNTWEGGAGGPDDIAKVTVTHRWTIFTPLIKPFFTDGQVNLTVESSMKNEGRFE